MLCFAKEDLPPLLTACVSYGILLGLHPEALAQKHFSTGTTPSLDISSFQLEDKFPLLLDLINFIEAQHYWIGFTPKARMGFKGQQHSDVMRFFFFLKLPADFQKNFLQFVKGNSLVFLERMKNQKAKLHFSSKLD